jgi:hypothetical protein
LGRLAVTRNDKKHQTDEHSPPCLAWPPFARAINRAMNQCVNEAINRSNKQAANKQASKQASKQRNNQLERNVARSSHGLLPQKQKFSVLVMSLPLAERGCCCVTFWGDWKKHAPWWCHCSGWLARREKGGVKSWMEMGKKRACYMWISASLEVRNDHTNMTAPLPVCSAKLSMFGPG